ncbi:bacillithiol system redox-active protein YtxJ [Gemmatimonas sp.]|uniref:bacillithiol system redox-active protein YtxJ n=1 Tax=Gemmatimonas sp. TaxID=1962908 RepID=UPI0027BB1009|nr:bacillithiol system redox-active protein YtxJ [Gemmatimonas sp.]
MNASVVPAAVTDAEFAARVLQSPVPVLVDVWAAWCQPCVTLKPVMQRLAESYSGRATVLTLDADTNLEMVTAFDVRALPTVLLFDRGALVARQSGAQSLATYVALLDGQLAARSAGQAPQAIAPTTPAPAVLPTDSPAVREARELAAAGTPTVLFKHSATCSISISVKREYDAFVRQHPDIPTRLVVVQQERPLSNALADVLQVRHESPQALVVRDGQVLWHASHHRITAERMAAAVVAASRTL